LHLRAILLHLPGTSILGDARDAISFESSISSSIVRLTVKYALNARDDRNQRDQRDATEVGATFTAEESIFWTAHLRGILARAIVRRFGDSRIKIPG